MLRHVGAHVHLEAVGVEARVVHSLDDAVSENLRTSHPSSLSQWPLPSAATS
ncbi:hypothetical protein K8P10_002839 [Leucobacter sp. Psy1]|nr:hypothetical protein K8P10_002839 [Leucobacter sp. Psy1]